MTQYSLAPGYVKLHYTTVVSSVSMSHVMVLPILPSVLDGDDTLLIRKGAAAQLWSTCVDDFVAVLKAIMSAAGLSTIDFADLFSQADVDTAPVFESSHLIGVAGTGGSATQTNGQDTMSFRTSQGNKFNLRIIESINNPNVHQPYSILSTANKAIVDLLLGDDGFVVGRDGAYPSVFLFHTTKYNDVIRRKRLGL